MLLPRRGRIDDQARTENSDCPSVTDYDAEFHTYASIPDLELDTSDSYRHAKLYFDSDSDCHRDIYGYRFSYAVHAPDLPIYSYSNQYADAHPDPYSNLNADQDLDSFSPTNAYFHGDLYFHGDPDSDLYTYLYINFYSNTNANCFFYCYFFSNKCCYEYSLNAYGWIERVFEEKYFDN